MRPLELLFVSNQLTSLVLFYRDIKRARALLQSLIKTNPKHAPGWVAAAWLENVAGKSVQARKIIAEGCEQCPTNEDVWIAASELNVRVVSSEALFCLF